MENWKYLNENYKVSDKGNIYSIMLNRNMKPYICSGGYYRIHIKHDGELKRYRVHQLVAMCFLGYKPNGKHDVVVDHINEIKTDNILENLRLVSARQNLSRLGGSSKYVGVSKFRDKWMSRIRINNILEYLGLYQTEEEAHRAYVKRLKEHTSSHETNQRIT
jgi:hypothetical protein